MRFIDSSVSHHLQHAEGRKKEAWTKPSAVLVESCPPKIHAVVDELVVPMKLLLSAGQASDMAT